MPECQYSEDCPNSLYERSLKILKELPQTKFQGDHAAEPLRRWAKQEKLAWHEAVTADPLLPDRLLPAGYLGKKAWSERTRILALAHRLNHPG